VYLLSVGFLACVSYGASFGLVVFNYRTYTKIALPRNPT
jgi:hypothetical protein